MSIHNPLTLPPFCFEGIPSGTSEFDVVPDTTVPLWWRVGVRWILSHDQRLFLRDFPLLLRIHVFFFFGSRDWTVLKTIFQSFFFRFRCFQLNLAWPNDALLWYILVQRFNFWAEIPSGDDWTVQSAEGGDHFCWISFNSTFDFKIHLTNNWSWKILYPP